jgi:hypothetical protein
MALPECFAKLLAAWNERDPAAMRRLIEEGVTADVEFCDPQHALKGIDAFTAMVKAFQDKNPGVTLIRSSAIDRHHDRARYAWAVVYPNGSRFDGFDSVQLNAAATRVCRIDGYFGPLKPA